MTFYIILALSCFLISLLGTRLTILALRKRTVLIDIPNLRSNHITPTPKGGGIAIVTALIICLLIADIHFSIILSILLLAAISLLDDLISVPVPIRLGVQIVAVAIALSVVSFPIISEDIPQWLDKLLISLAWIWFINLFNFMDGIDGLSGSEILCIGAGLTIPAVMAGGFPDELSIYGLLLIAAAAGFLWWNWYPAKIFLGDVGSIPLGFFIGYVLLLAFQQGYVYVVFILPAYYIADGGITLLRRLWQGEKIWTAHSEHYYQQAVRAGRSHGVAVRYIFGVNLLLILLATLSVLEPDLAIFYLSLAYLSVFMLLGFFAHTPAAPHEKI